MIRERHCSASFNTDLSEKVAYDNPQFPAYIRKGNLSLYPDYAASSHWHEELEFILVCEGSMTYNVNGKLITLRSGNGIFVNSRQLHYGFSDKKEGCSFLCILLSPSLLASNTFFYENYIEPFIRNTGCPYIMLEQSVDWNMIILDLLQEIFEKKDEALSEFLIQRNFFSIMEILYAHNKPNQEKEKNNSRALNTLKQMILYIEQNYRKKITLLEIAKSGHCCKSKCISLFKHYLKDSPIVYLNKLRLQKSCILLLDTDLSVTEVAFECGFHGSSYYCESFRKYFQVSPTEYRNRVNNPFAFPCFCPYEALQH